LEIDSFSVRIDEEMHLLPKSLIQISLVNPIQATNEKVNRRYRLKIEIVCALPVEMIKDRLGKVQIQTSEIVS
jgi:hypothetical protein